MTGPLDGWSILVGDGQIKISTKGELIAAIDRATGKASDGHHTFEELYRYRMLYNAALFSTLAALYYSADGPWYQVHKSWRHADGGECFGGGWFIVMATLPTGQISNHYQADAWDLFDIPVRECADEWDGHTPEQAADRLEQWLRGAR